MKDFGFCPAARAWLRENGLLEASFPTRARALDAFVQTVVLAPPPKEAAREETPRLIRNQEGSYRSRCGHWQITKVKGGWRCRRDSEISGVHQELEQLGVTLSTIALQIDNIENGRQKREAQRELYLSAELARG